MSACSQCNKPCIVVGGKCQIAKARIALNLSFKQAYEVITGVSQHKLAGEGATAQMQSQYHEWMQQGEPSPLMFEI